MLWKKKAGKFPDSQTTRQHHRRLRWILCRLKFLNCGFKTATSLKILSLFLAFSGPGCTGGHSGCRDGPLGPYPWFTAQRLQPSLMILSGLDLQEPRWKTMCYSSNSHMSPRVGNRSRHQQMLHDDIILGSVLPFCTWSPYSAPTAMQAGATFTAQAVFTPRKTSIFS